MIMDGNGRWAKQQGKPRLFGHQAGTENLREIIKACVEFGVRYLTVYAFSTENWNRPDDEVKGLMRILADALERELPELHRQGVRLRHIGRLERLNPVLMEKIRQAMELTRDNDRLDVIIAWNYGGRDEIVAAIEKIVSQGYPVEQVNEKLVADSLFTAGIPDPDLVVRTSGEYRTSNFLLWQTAYSEWYFPPVYWPDFNRVEFHKGLQDYARRERRFGKTSEQLAG
ncbi:MAG: di-trans,poly-cis-decaprenylcistransferase [Anaerolineae bacterium]|nr:di-trans,poly-cis-decaprenylcistransferase [Anaerolineae bacterium]